MYQYRVKVKGTTYIWGGAGITGETSLDAMLILRVEPHGEPITIGLSRPEHNPPAERLVTLGSLKPNEVFCVKLDDIAGVWATVPAPKDSSVECSILAV